MRVQVLVSSPSPSPSPPSMPSLSPSFTDVVYRHVVPLRSVLHPPAALFILLLPSSVSFI